VGRDSRQWNSFLHSLEEERGGVNTGGRVLKNVYQLEYFEPQVRDSRPTNNKKNNLPIERKSPHTIFNRLRKQGKKYEDKTLPDKSKTFYL